MTSREFQDRLARRSRRAGIAVPPETALRLETYYRLLATWNQKINLTGLNLVEPTPEAIDRLLIEPLVAARHAGPGVKRLVDIGSGGGSPAVPFALALPGSHLLMVESKTRKSVFLREVLRATSLSGLVVTSRFEELLTQPALHEAHDILTIRAVRIEARILANLQALVRPGGNLFLFRGAGGGESFQATPLLTWRATYPLIESLQSRLVVLGKRSPTR